MNAWPSLTRRVGWLLLPVLATCLAVFFVSCSRKPSIDEATPGDKPRFRIVSGSRSKPVTSVRVWSHTRDIRLWELGSGYYDGQKLRPSEIDYGIVPRGLLQAFPGDNESPSMLQDEEIIVVDITYLDDHFIAPGMGWRRKVFRHSQGDLFMVEKRVPYFAPQWESEEERNTFSESISKELRQGDHEAQFLKWARTSNENNKHNATYEALLQVDVAKRTDPIQAYLNLRKLSTLKLSGPEISDISMLRDLTQLEHVILRNTNVVDLSPLQNLKSLEALSLLEKGKVKSIEPLAKLKSLSSLTIEDNEVSDVSALAGLTTLHRLEMPDNSIVDITPLANLKNLWDVDLSRNRIVDTSPLEELPQLWVIELRGNQVSNVKPLVKHFQLMGTKPGSLIWRLDIRENPIGDKVLLSEPWMSQVDVKSP